MVGFFVFGFLIYGYSLRNGFVRWDDGSLITENSAIRQINAASLKAIVTNYDPELYIPLTFFSYQLDYRVGGTDPFVYHLQNLVWHVLNALLVSWLFFLLTRGRKGVALLAGLLFLAHPLHTEAVAWAAARKDVLSTFFFLASLIAYLFYRESGNRRTYWTGIVLFLLGLLAKVMVITLPLILFLVDFRESRRWSWAMVREKVPHLVLSLLFGIIALFGKQQLLGMTPWTVKVLLALKSAVFSIGLFFWPVHLSVLYPFTGAVTFASPAFLVPIFLLLLLLGVTAWTTRWTRDIAFGVLFFLLTIAPTFTNLTKGELYLGSDRYVYIPSIGLLWLSLLIASVFWDAAAAGKTAAVRRAMMVVPAALLLFLGAGAFAQSLVWKDTAALFRNVLAFYPQSFIAHNNLGSALRRDGKIDEAVAEYRMALQEHPAPKTWSNLGSIYREQGKTADAIAAYREGIKSGSGSAEPYLGLGLLYAKEGDAAKALDAYGKAIALDPHYAEAYTDRGSLFLDRGDVEKATPDLLRAVALDPLLVEARYNLALAYLKSGKKDEATRQLRLVVSLRPDFLTARLQLGVLAYQAGDSEEAKAQFREVLRLDPSNASARSALQQIGAQGL
jgi:Tfp pilus assembly protein PilF